MGKEADTEHKKEKNYTTKESIKNKLTKLRAYVDGDADTPYEFFMLLVILVNIICLGIETSKNISGEIKNILSRIDLICFGIFCAELIFKFVVYNKDFFFEKIIEDNKKRIHINWWNISDLIIILVCALSYLSFLYINVLRIFRVFRSLKVIKAIRSAKVVKSFKLIINISGIRIALKAIIRAIPGIIWTFSLLAIFAYVYAIIGTNIFSEEFPDFFGSLGRSLLSLCQITTFDSWVSQIARPIVMKHPWAWVYFISYAFTAAYVLMNVITGFIVDSMQKERDKHKEKKQKEEQKDKLTLEQISLQIADLQKQIADLHNK